MLISGYITRSNLASPLPNLAIQQDPYWILTGDANEAADQSTAFGFSPGQRQLKQIWADSPFVAGEQQVLATLANQDLVLRMIVTGTSVADMTTKAGYVDTAVTQQQTYQISLTFDTQTFTYNCYTGQTLPAYNQMPLFGGLLPLYVICKRDPIPVAGPF